MLSSEFVADVLEGAERIASSRQSMEVSVSDILVYLRNTFTLFLYSRKCI